MSNRAVIALAGAVAACAPIEEAPDATFERSQPVEVWHVDDDGVAHVIEVPAPAVDAHVVHGDWTNPIHVDPAATPGGNGLAENPLRRLTDALAIATEMRAANSDAPITILAAPGTYKGTYSSDNLASYPNREILPVWIDVPNLALRGSTELVFDADGIPTGEVVPGTASILVADAALAGGPLVFVSDSNHADGTTHVGDDVTIAGWILDSANTTGTGSGSGVTSLRVEGLVLEDMVARRFGNLADLRSTGALMSRLYSRTTGSCSLCLAEGSYEVTDSRIQDGLVGVFLAEGIQGVSENIGLNTGRTLTPGLAPVHGVGSLRIDGCDLTDHTRNPLSSGIRIVALGPGVAPVAQSTTAEVEVSDTRFGNSTNGIGMDAGFISRDFPDIHTVMDVTLRDNHYGTFAKAPIYVTFMRGQPALGQGPRGTAPYLRGSDWALSLEGTDEDMLSAVWIDTPTVDPFGPDTLLDNNLVVEGTPVPAPVCQGAWPATTCPL